MVSGFSHVKLIFRINEFINLFADETITLRNNSSISAEAVNNGNGGNLAIDTDFIIAFN